jgi:transposase
VQFSPSLKDLTKKKTLYAAEQHEEWKKLQEVLDIKKLVFIDETWTKTNMTPLYGWAEIGKRVMDYVPHGHWKTTTFVAALRHDGLTAPMVVDGAIHGELFLAYVEQILVPTLHKGDIVVMDYLRSHTVVGVQKAMESAGAKVLYLPPYSPDLNPIEMVFSKLKTLVRKAKVRTMETLWKKLGELCDIFTPKECQNYFRHAGYQKNKQSKLKKDTI